MTDKTEAEPYAAWYLQLDELAISSAESYRGASVEQFESFVASSLQLLQEEFHAIGMPQEQASKLFETFRRTAHTVWSAARNE